MSPLPRSARSNFVSGCVTTPRGSVIRARITHQGRARPERRLSGLGPEARLSRGPTGAWHPQRQPSLSRSASYLSHDADTAGRDHR